MESSNTEVQIHKNKKRKVSDPSAALHRISPQVQFSIRKPLWIYIHLEHLSLPSHIRANPTSKSNNTEEGQNLDPVTAHLHLTSALSSFLGIHGTAIPVDILKLEGSHVWIRVPAEDRTGVIAAVGGWVKVSTGEKWRVRGWSAWNVDGEGRKGGGGQDLFD